ncbi:TetR/AcrR family transcriptional regulator [Tenacibaculum aiptasiae]|uniref:TetR/AcrR family transcriptional regulator n=1 Tax=Tenacibaculum aiptasiae TaxID=426481 RepID=UPI002330A615|nr:TetR/AcrR family transcriptional regulator [Tenacibaculum aiptasiae]
MNKKENILNAALELLVTKGVHNTPMSEVAKKAGTGMGTIYNYFPNKEALINEIYIGIKEQEETLFLKVSTDATIKKQFVDYLKVIINFFIHNPSYFNFLQQLEASPIITKENKVKGQKSVEIVAILLEKGKLNKIIKNISTQEILVFIGGGISSYLKQNLNNSEKATTSLKNHIQMIWDGIKE